MQIQTGEENTKRFPLKKTVKFFAYLFLVIFLLSGSLPVLLYVYGDEVKAAIVKELNKHLKAEVRIDPQNIDLTIFRSFPNCALEFKDVLMLEALPVKKRDTLLFAGEISLYFNIRDLWNKHYQIKRVKFKNVLLQPTDMKNGKNNYTFWDDSSDPENKQQENISFKLDLLEIERCKVIYKNKPQFLKTEFEIEELAFSGNFSEKTYGLETEGKLYIQKITKQKRQFLRNKTLNLALSLEVNSGDYVVKKAKLNLNKLTLSLSGGFTYSDSLEKLNVSFKAPSLDISSALSLLPQEFQKIINDYESDGDFYASGSLSYVASKGILTEGMFGIKNGEITYKPLSTKATRVNVEANYKYGDGVSFVDIKEMGLKLNNDVINASCSVRNFEHPEINLTASAAMDLQNVQNFWPLDTITRLEGRLELNTSISGKLSDLKSRAFSDKVKLNLNAGLKNLLIGFKGDEKIYAIENCSLTAREREIEVRELKIKRGSSDLNVSGKMPGVFNYLSDRTAPLIIIGTLQSQTINLEDFMPAATGSGAGNNNPVIPANVEFKFDASISQFSYSGFLASNISANLQIKNQKAMLSDVKLEAMQGEAELDVLADNSGGQLDVFLQSRLNTINITQLFTQFNNFGQSTLVDKNLSGFASATVSLKGSWSNSLSADYNSIKASAALVIERGRLVNFKPLESLGNYIDVNDLRDIKFSSLQSNVEIENQTITIPRTSIKNSALNIELWGTHTFDNVIDYHIQLLISEFMARRRKDKDDGFGPVENDPERRQSAFIRMKGPIDAPQIKFDGKGLKEKIKADVKNEKQNIKQLFKEEFGLFKKDSLKPLGKKQEAVFELEKPLDGVKKDAGPKKKEEDDEDF